MSIVYLNGSTPNYGLNYRSNSKDDEETDSALGSSHSNHSPELPSREERFEDYGVAEDPEPELLHTFGEKKSPLNVPSFVRTASVRRSVRQRPSPASVRRTPSFGLNGHGSNKNSPIAHHRHVVDGDQDQDDDWNSVDSFQREDDVYHFSQQMEKLQNQVATLVQSQANQEDNVSKLRQDNAALLERCTLLEEQLREQEVKYEERLRDEHKKHLDVLQRLERDKANELEHRNNRIGALESEVTSLRNASIVYQTQAEKCRLEKTHYQDKLSEVERQMTEITDENCRMKEVLRREREELSLKSTAHDQELNEIRLELENLRNYKIENEKYSSSFNRVATERVREVELELQRMKQENTRLEEANQELNIQVMSGHISHGQSLLQSEMGSLFAEFSKTDSSKEELLDRLKEQQEVNRKLKAYMDQVLADVIERAPQLLEAKRK